MAYRIRVVELQVAEQPEYPPETRIHTSRLAADILRPFLVTSHVERFMLLALNAKLRPTDVIEISKGTLDMSLVHPRETYLAAVKLQAHSIIVGHNHPSGDKTPSTEDLKMTRKLRDAGEILGIPLLDHIIIAGEDYYSLADNNWS